MCKLILEYASYKMIIETEIPKAIINLHNNNTLECTLFHSKTLYFVIPLFYK